jgi:hypothetical protein
MRLPAALLVLAGTLSAADTLEFFEKNVRPILAGRCQSCHGAKMGFAGLRLHAKADALKGSDNGPVIIPGEPASSKLIQAVKGVAAKRMPPTGPLAANEIATLEKWIHDGAVWPDERQTARVDPAQHWCWKPVRNVAFQQRWLASNSKPAARTTLLRRVTFDLTGLPPAPEEIAEFERDGNYERVVDRLLSSPRYGERMARRWMDLIRYSESHGSEGDPDVPNAWRYRDYLIRAFNDDVPYDQLIREHIAGDLLDRPRVTGKVNESVLATAHFRMVEHGFQPVDPWEDRVKWADNQIDVFSKAFQGITISCSRCHDHKFDAIKQKDFYALFGTFAGMRPTQVAIDPVDVLTHNRDALAVMKPKVRSAIRKLWRRAVDDAVSTPVPDARDENSPLYPLYSDGRRQWFDKWRKELARRADFNAKNFRTLFNVGPGWFRQGIGIYPIVSEPGEFAVEISGPRAINGIYPRGVFSGLLSRKHGAVYSSPRFKIETDSLSFRMLGGNFGAANLIIENYAVPRGGIYNLRSTAKRDQMGWVQWDTSFWKGFTAYLEFSTLDETTHFMLDDEDNRMKPKPKPAEDGRSWFGTAGRVVVSDSKSKPEEELIPARLLIESNVESTSNAIRTRLRELLIQAIDDWHNGTLSDEQSVFLDYFVRQRLLPNSADDMPLIAGYRRLESEIQVPRRAPGILEEAPPDHPLLVRGDHRKLGDPVPRGYLEVLNGPRYTDARTTRLQLANEIASPSNPLTARVMVNRLWQYVFREGIVRTPDNFGRLGELPSDPELLDWLSSRFIEDSWSIKKMMRLLVLSKRYQASDLPLRRLEAEEIRDAILAATGKLDLTMYGKSVPVYYAHDEGATKGDRPKGPLDGERRRSIYLEIRRNATNPFLEAFDVYKPASTRGKRDVTNVPGQSLALMNSPFVVEQVNQWAAEKPDVDTLYVRVLGRKPSAEERDRAQTYAAGEGPANLALALFNMKEFLYVQ